MNSSPSAHERINSNPRGTFDPMMVKLASMRPSFPTDPSSLSMFDIPRDSYYNSVSLSSQQTQSSTSSLKFDIYNSFDIYGNELDVDNERIRTLYEGDNDMNTPFEENNLNGKIKINKENTHPRTNTITPMKSTGTMGRIGLDREARSPLFNITPAIPLKKSGEKSESKIERVLMYNMSLEDKDQKRGKKSNITKGLR